jgi:hypothetical protein
MNKSDILVSCLGGEQWKDSAGHGLYSREEGHREPLILRHAFDLCTHKHASSLLGAQAKRVTLERHATL